MIIEKVEILKTLKAGKQVWHAGSVLSATKDSPMPKAIIDEVRGGTNTVRVLVGTGYVAQPGEEKKIVGIPVESYIKNRDAYEQEQQAKREAQIRENNLQEELKVIKAKEAATPEIPTRVEKPEVKIEIKKPLDDVPAKETPKQRGRPRIKPLLKK